MRDHPAPSLLHRFLNGELSKTEAPAVVRHLLAGCPHCREQLGAETGRLLSQDLPPRERLPGAEPEPALQCTARDAACRRIEASELRAQGQKLHRLLVVHGMERVPLEGFSAGMSTNSPSGGRSPAASS